MKKYEFRQINSSNIIQLAELLLQRQKRESTKFPHLVNDKQNKTFIIETLNELFSNTEIVGLGAYFNEQLVGYLFGIIKVDTERGRHVWVPYEGVAIKESENEELIIYLYAEASKIWIQYGCYKNYAVLPVGDEKYVSAFQRLSFAYDQVHGILNIDTYEPFDLKNDINVRIATKSDRHEISRMADIIFSYQNQSPIYAPALPEAIKNIRKGYEGIVDDEETLVLLAENNSETLGFQVYYQIESDLMIPENGVELSVAGTYESYMGLGVGKNLMNKAIKTLNERGYKYIISDWRITNLSSSSFWKKCDFQVIAYRMYRQLDERLAWANFHNPIIKCHKK